MTRTVATSAARKPRSRYHHGDLRRALVQEVVRTIQRHGVETLTLRAVAQTLGVSRTALYRHFADKSALLGTVAGEGFRTLRLALADAWERGGHGRRGFEEMGVGYGAFAVANPSYYRVMFGGFIDAAAGTPELANEGRGAFQLLVDAIVEQQEKDLLRDDDPLQMALFIWAMVHGIAMLAIDGQMHGRNTEPEALTRYAIDRVRHGIAQISRGRT